MASNDYNAEPTWGETGRKFWPDTRSEAGARHALKLACFAYNTMAVLLLIFGWKDFGFGAWLLLDLSLLVLISFGVYKGSAVVALVGVAYVVLSTVLTLWMQPTGCVFLMVSALLFVGTLNGIRGAFALRRPPASS